MRFLHSVVPVVEIVVGRVVVCKNLILGEVDWDLWGWCRVRSARGNVSRFGW